MSKNIIIKIDIGAKNTKKVNEMASRFRKDFLYALQKIFKRVVINDFDRLLGEYEKVINEELGAQIRKQLIQKN